MKKNLLVILAIVLSSNMLFAQLNGTYTINQSIAASASNYQSFSAAAAALNTLGINGPVVFNVSNGPYTERVTINQITGASAINTMTINGNGDTLKYNSTHGSIGVLELIGTDFLTVDNLVIYNTHTLSTSGMCIKMVNGTDENVISNCTIQSSTINIIENRVGIKLYAVFNINGAGYPQSNHSNFSNANPGNNNLFTDNTFKYGSVQIQIIGADINKPSNNQIVNNYFEDTSLMGIEVTGSSNTLISGNDFSRQNIGDELIGHTKAMEIGNSNFHYFNEFLVVEKNKIHDMNGGQLLSVQSSYGIMIRNDSVVTGKETIIKNNVIYLNTGLNISEGIYLYKTRGVKIFHNTIVMKSLNAPSGSVTTGIRTHSNESYGYGNVEIKNNIIDISITGAWNVYGLYITNGIIADHNVYNLNGGITVRTFPGVFVVYPTTASWSSSGFGGANSFDAVPNYVNPAGLNFLPQAASIIDAGDNLSPVVSDDITGAIRPMGTFPDPGAYEIPICFPIFNNDTISICQGDSLLINGSWETTTGNYIDTLQTTIGCDSVLTTTLYLVNALTTNTSTTICQGDSLLINGAWENTTGTYIDTLQTTTGCDSVLTTVLSVVVPSITNTSTTICQGDSLLINGTWENTAGTYVETLQTTTGCDSIVTIILTISPLPIITTNNDTTINIGEIVTLSAAGGTSYTWSPSTDLSCTNCANTDVSPTSTTTYTVTGTNTNGCTSLSTVTITVDDFFDVFLPNVFSPNNDGQNDVFFVRGNGIKTMNLLIYNRWGQKVFESSNQNEGWDGTFKGKEMNAGVFFYILSIESYTAIKEQKKGSITLLR